MIIASHTIIYPDTVVIVAINTLVANVTMFWCWCPNNLAGWAQVLWILNFLYKVHKAYALHWLYIPWVFFPCDKKEYVGGEKQQNKHSESDRAFFDIY